MSHTSTKGKINRESHSSHATSELRRDSSVIETRIIRWGNTEEEAAQDTYENESEKLGKFAKLLRKEKHRFEYLTWGETSPTPVIYSQLQDYKMKQVQCGGKHFLALSGLLPKIGPKQKRPFLFPLKKLLTIYCDQ